MPSRDLITPAALILYRIGLPLALIAYAFASLWGTNVWILDDVAPGAGAAAMLFAACTLTTAMVWPDIDVLHYSAAVAGLAAWVGRSLAYVLVGLDESRWSVLPAIFVHVPLAVGQILWHVGMLQQARANVDAAAHAVDR